jgi:hypothetical protein
MGAASQRGLAATHAPDELRDSSLSLGYNRVTASPPTRLYIQQASGVEIQGYGGITSLGLSCATKMLGRGCEVQAE